MKLETFKKVYLLFIAQIFGLSGSIIMTFLGGIVGMDLSPSENLVTLPVAITIVGAAVFAIPSAMIMRKIGRYKGNLLAAIFSLLASLLAVVAIEIHSFLLFCIAAFVIGVNSAFVQQYRFAVIEGVARGYATKAVSILLFGNIIGVYLATEAGKWGMHLFSTNYVGSYVLLMILQFFSVIALSQYKESVVPANVKPLGEVKEMHSEHQIIEKNLVPAMVIAATSYFVMSLIMVGTPVAMHVIDHMSMQNTTFVMQSHLIAMYFPSLIVGFVVARIGNIKVIAAGILCLCFCVLISFLKISFHHYLFALILLGIGWNLTFICATTILTESYHPEKRFKMQAVNDFFVFGLNAVAALCSGSLIFIIGWKMLSGLATIGVFAMAISAFFIWKETKKYQIKARLAELP